MGQLDLGVRIRRGEGKFFGTLKSLAGKILHFHIPVVGPTKAFFGLLYQLHVLMRDLSIWGARFFWFEPLFRSQCDAIGERFQMEQLPYLTGSGRISIGSNVRLSGMPSIGFTNRNGSDLPEIRIGDSTFVGHGCRFSVARAVRIGSHCLLASGVQIQDHDGHPIDATRRRRNEPPPAHEVKAVTIGDDVWIGSGAMILKGVSIGDRAIVGARAVVTKDVPADAIVAGNPARIVRDLMEMSAAELEANSIAAP